MVGALLRAWPHLSAFIPGEDTKGPLNHDEVRSAIRLWLICIHMRVCVRVPHACVHMLRANRQLCSSCGSGRQAPAIRQVPGGNGTEHLANQLQLSPLGLKVSPPAGMIYSHVERGKTGVVLFLLFPGRVDGLGEERRDY